MLNLRNGILGLTLTSALALGAASANAADIYQGGMKEAPIYVPPITWTGFYVGAHIGGAWADFDVKRNDFFGHCDGYRICDGHDAGVGLVWDDSVFVPGRSFSTSGVFGGGQIGYNWQSVNFVYGVELDLGGMGLGNDDHAFLFTAPVSGDTVAFRIKSDGAFYGDITGRLGYTWGNAMIYAKGGFAWLNANFEAQAVIHNKWTDTDTILNGNNNNNTITGFTIGGGLEYLFNPSWSVKAEYLFFDFTDLNNGHLFDGGINDFRFFNNDLQVNTFKVGINYHFHQEYVPLK